MAATKNIFISCISYSNCSDENACCNQYTNTEEVEVDDEVGIEWENAEEKDLEYESIKM